MYSNNSNINSYLGRQFAIHTDYVVSLTRLEECFLQPEAYMKCVGAGRVA